MRRIATRRELNASMPTPYCRAAARFLVAAAILLFAVTPSGRAKAAPSAQGVDAVLSTLAEVIRDRAKLVAAQTIQERIVDHLCSGSFTMTTGAKVTFYLGGRSPGSRRNTDTCLSEDVFVGTCSLAKRQKLPLQDVHFLNQFAEDVVLLAVRVAAYEVDSCGYDSFGLRVLAKHVAKGLRRLAGRKVEWSDFAEGLYQAAAELRGKSYNTTLIDDIAKQPSTLALVGLAASARGTICVATSPSATSPSAHKDLCQARLPVQSVLSRPPAETMLSLGSAYEAYLARGPFERAAHVPCSKAGYKNEELELCRVAQLNRLLRGLYKLAPSTAGAPAVDSDHEVRQLAHIIREAELYEDAASADGADAKRKIGALVQGIRRAARVAPLPALAALTSSLRFVAASLFALAEAPEETRAWVSQLDDDLDAFLATCTTADTSAAGALARCRFDRLIDGSALGPIAPKGKRVREMRDALKSVLVLPWVYGSPTPVLDDLIVAVHRLRLSLQLFRSADGTRALRGLELLSHLFAMLPTLMPADGQSGSASLKPALRGIDAVATAMRFASEKDWVAVGMMAADGIESVADQDTARLMGFARVLLRVHQAETREEAKAAFESALEDVASRGQRYDELSVDLGAIVAARGGYGRWRERRQDNTTDWKDEGFGGLYTPFGIMVASGWFGMIMYPVDLGAYMVASTEDGDPRYTHAFRPGVSIYARPSRRTPISVGMGGDFRPAWDRETELSARAFVWVGGDLPLYILK